RGNNAVHINADRIGRDVRGLRCPAAFHTQLQLAPARQQLGADTELVGEPPNYRDDLIRCLAVDIEDPCEGKAQLGTFFTGHYPFSWAGVRGPRVGQDGPTLADDLPFSRRQKPSARRRHKASPSWRDR